MKVDSTFWQGFIEINEFTKELFSEKDFAVHSNALIELLKNSTQASEAVFVLNHQEEISVYKHKETLDLDLPDLLGSLPLLYQSYEPTPLEPEELTDLCQTVFCDSNVTFTHGFVFSLELSSRESLCFALVFDENSDAEQGFQNIIRLAKYLEQQVNFAINSAQGEALADKLRQQKKRQNTWLESLAWLNDVGNGEYSDDELSKLYKTALFQMKIIGRSGSAVAFSYDEHNHQLTPIITYEDVGLSDFVITRQKNSHDWIDEIKDRSNQKLTLGNAPELPQYNLHAALLYPIFIDNKLEMLLCLGRTEDPFEEHEAMVSFLFAEGIEHILERMHFLRAMRHQNAVLHKEKLEQQTLIKKLKEAQEQLLQQEKMASIGQLAAGVAHEINNPVGYVNSNINSMEGYVEDLYRLLDVYGKIEAKLPQEHSLVKKVKGIKEEIDYDFIKDDIGDLVNESKEGVVRVKQIVKDLKDFSHVDEAEWQKADIEKGIDSTLNIVHNELKYKATVVKEYGDIPEIQCVASQVNQVIMNLLVNAGHAIEEQGEITIRTGHVDEDNIFVEVQDTGKGIAPENVKKIFDPFFTTKPVGEGTGLGLSLSYSIAEKHHGELSVSSKLGVGTTFRLCLPIKQEGRVDDYVI